MFINKFKFFIILVGCLYGQIINANTPSIQMTDHVQWLKSLTPSLNTQALSAIQEKNEKYWQPIYEQTQLYRPIVISELQRELKLQTFTPIVLLDLGAFLAFNQHPDDFQLVDRVIRKLNVTMPMINQFNSIYYRMVLAYATSSHAKTLPVLDRILLPNITNSFNADKTPNSYRVHTFGVFGEKAIPYLLKELKKSKNTQRQETLLRVLRTICTEQCNQAVYDLVQNGASHTALSHAGFTLLDLGGPHGRDLFLKLEPAKFSAKSAAWLKDEFAYAKKLTYARFLKKFEAQHVKSKTVYTKKEFLLRMKEMQTNLRLFIRSHPHDFTNSKLDKKVLIDHLLTIRKQLFRIVNIHGGEYVAQVNEIINALYYRKTTL